MSPYHHSFRVGYCCIQRRWFVKKITSFNLRDSDSVDILRQKLKLSFKAKIGVVCSFILGSVLFVTHTVWSLSEKLRFTHEAHEADRRTRFIYIDKPLALTMEDIFPDTFRGKFKYHTEKYGRKVLPWVQSKSKDPALLLNLAESRDPEIRRLGLKSLTGDNDWEDHQFRKVAQACSNRTMVSLARIQEADNRLFRPMPWLPPPKATIEDELRGLLSKLQKDITDTAIQKYTTRVLPKEKQKSIVETGPWSFGGTALEYARSASDDSEGQVELLFMETLAIHSQITDQLEKIVENGALQLFQRILMEYEKIREFRPLIARILANLALNVKLHKLIIEGGWVAVLHKWLSTKDTALFFYTTRALANLDRDMNTDIDVDAMYDEGIYPGYPVFRSREVKHKVKVDIVFIHGLRGGPFKTWRQEDRRHTETGFVVTDEFRRSHTFFWPKDWLAHDLKDVRILNVGYDTELTTWNLKHPLEAEKRTLSSRSATFIEKLRKADIGSRPVIWVGHSMGGLLIKDILRLAQSTPRYRCILDNTIGVLNYSVPHRGSSLATFSKKYGVKYTIFPSTEVLELDKEKETLKSLLEFFNAIALQRGILVLNFGETEKTQIGMNIKLHVVPPESADPGIGDFHLIKSDHINICKPRDVDSALYTLSRDFMRKCIQKHEDRRKKLNRKRKQSDREESEY
ncbi:protein SERAC1-like isoform X3 [Dreissena polymorpha]|uniref:protein SERAC1-like isoform X3 n=1 Tax=Dreissena polymorpha TaxID=45954 RepID=UPI0022647F1B|nr:protein SERAC1-like isoform X3 [Dreissena polymorpha]